MKPISLTMQAFGPYLDAATVDFSRLGEHPIFLITGSTGGGKTTILDAMCFALYCRATGGRRSWGSMRSTSAPDDRATLVDFAFSLGGGRIPFLPISGRTYRPWKRAQGNPGRASLLQKRTGRMAALAQRK